MRSTVRDIPRAPTGLTRVRFACARAASLCFRSRERESIRSFAHHTRPLSRAPHAPLSLHSQYTQALALAALLAILLLLAGAGLANPDETRSDDTDTDPDAAARSRADGLYRRAVAIR